jgi:2-succinyl-6-hydroxy-2,4-cyclohexadiene-1-carboxylate synthase
MPPQNRNITCTHRSPPSNPVIPPLTDRLIGHPRQPLIVFLHGFLGRGDDFCHLAEGIVDRYSSLLIDLPGHGGSLLTDDNAYTMAGAAALIIDRMTARQFAPVGIYGYSMGGRLALYLALHYPHHIDRAMIAAASPGCRTQTERLQRQQADRALADRLSQMSASDFGDFLQHWYAQPLFQSLQRHPNFATIYNQRLQNNPKFLAKSLLGMGTGFQPPLWELLRQPQCPLHFLAGSLDHKFSQLQREMLAIASGSSATGSVIQQTGHNLHWENPEAVIREIASFFPGSNFYNAT